MINKLLFLALFISSFTFAQDYKKMIQSGNHTVEEIREVANLYFKDHTDGLKEYKRWEYRALLNMNALGKLPSTTELQDEFEKFNAQTNANKKTTFQGSWQEMGPDVLSSSGNLNGIGNVKTIAIESTNSNHILAGAETGGVWKSTNGGATWTCLTDNQICLDVFSLTIHPNNPNIYYWGSSGGRIYISNNGGGTWSLLSTLSGEVNKILVDPTHSNKIYASAEKGGGLFKSTDSGATWSRIHPNALEGFDLAFKPNDSNIVYATGYDFYKSVDGGQTFTPSTNLPLANWTKENISGNYSWNTIYNTFSGNTDAYFGILNPNYTVNTTYASRLITKPINLQAYSNAKLKFSTKIFGNNNLIKVLYKTNINDSWTELTSSSSDTNNNWISIETTLPSVSTTCYIAFEGNLLLQSVNLSAVISIDDVKITSTNNEILYYENFDSFASSNSNSPKKIGVAKNATGSDSSVLYILEADYGLRGIHKSTDQGNTFSVCNTNAINLLGLPFAGYVGQTPRNMAIEVNPNNVNQVYIGGLIAWRTIDGGVTFEEVTNYFGLSPYDSRSYCHADINRFIHTNDKLWVCSDGGVYVANSPQGSISQNYFTNMTTGIGATQIYKIGVNKTVPEVISCGTQDNGTSLFKNGVWKNWLGGDGLETFVDKNDNNIIYGTTQYGVLQKTVDGGQTPIYLTQPQNVLNSWNFKPFEQDPTVTNTIYTFANSYADYGRKVFKSMDGGINWSTISNSLIYQNVCSPALQGTNILKIANSNNTIMYFSNSCTFYKTSDGGTTNWVIKNNFAGNINSIAIHPSNPDKIAVATTDSNKIYVSNDGGDTWIPYLFNLPNIAAITLVWDDNGQNGLYLGMTYGVYYIDDTMTEWQVFNNNLPNVEIAELEINKAANKIYAGTYGRGLWKSDLYDPQLSTQNAILNNVSIYPNPTSDYINITLKDNTPINIKIYDTKGAIVFYEKDLNLIEGKCQINVSNLSVGSYYLRVYNTTNYNVQKILIAH